MADDLNVVKDHLRIRLYNFFYNDSTPTGSMYGIYANIGGILMGSMLPYIAAPWILWDMIQPFRVYLLGTWEPGETGREMRACSNRM